MREMESLVMEEERGIVGDWHYGKDEFEKRQVLLLDRSALSEFGYSPGVLREQVLVDFPSLQGLPAGARLQIGTATVEITSDCSGCRHMAETVGEDPEGFVQKVMNRRGMLARVVVSGEVRPSDDVRLIAHD
ncbi:MAG: hypothetical protein IH851_08310 [Armatimonadetes bacterium]|nr:hypothetical protein [Armatimonadota bacterium]